MPFYQRSIPIEKAHDKLYYSMQSSIFESIGYVAPINIEVHVGHDYINNAPVHVSVFNHIYELVYKDIYSWDK